MHREAEEIRATLERHWPDIEPVRLAKSADVSVTWLKLLKAGQIKDPGMTRMLRLRDALKAQFG